MAFFAESVSGEWPVGIAVDHDAVLAESYVGRRGKGR